MLVQGRSQGQGGFPPSFPPSLGTDRYILTHPPGGFPPSLAHAASAVYTAVRNAMEIPHKVCGRVLVCSPEGDVDEATLCSIAELAASSHADCAHALILDMGAATYISSQGVASLLKLQTDLALRKRHVALAAPPPLVKRILYQAGIASAMTIHATVEDACAEAEKPSRA